MIMNKILCDLLLSRDLKLKLKKIESIVENDIVLDVIFNDSLNGKARMIMFPKEERLPEKCLIEFLLRGDEKNARSYDGDRGYLRNR